MDFEDLTAEQKEKAKACQTPEEILAFAKDEGFELDDKELDAIAGGATWDCFTDCPTDCDAYGGPY